MRNHDGHARGCDRPELGQDAELRAEKVQAEFQERRRRMEIYAAWVRSGGSLQNLAAVLAAVDAGLFDPEAFPDEGGPEKAERRKRFGHSRERDRLPLCDRCQRRRVSPHHEDGLCSDCRAYLARKERSRERDHAGCTGSLPV